MKRKLPMLSDDILLYLSESGSGELCMTVNEVLNNRKTLGDFMVREVFETNIETSLFYLFQNDYITYGTSEKLDIHYSPPKYTPRFQIFGHVLSFNLTDQLYDRILPYKFDRSVHFLINEIDLSTKK
jgi:hypothetical protein